MESRQACDLFATKLDEARAASLLMGLQGQVEAMKLLFTFLEHLQKDIIDRLGENSYDIVCHQKSASCFPRKPDSAAEPENDVHHSPTTSHHWSNSDGDCHLDHDSELALQDVDKMLLMRGLRQKILSAGGGSTTPQRRQTARKSGSLSELDNKSKFLQQIGIVSTPEVSASSSTSVIATTDFSSPSTSNDLVYRNPASPVTCATNSTNNTNALPVSFATNPCVSGHRMISALVRTRHARRPKINGRYFCSHAQCSESYLNLEHIVDHEHQHGTPDGKYLTCSFPGCNERFKWRHYLRRHERLCHSPVT